MPPLYRMHVSIRPTAPRLAFALVCALALLFAYYTNHVWEDYYITYRSSHNLATGHGLVFNQGEKLHTFTSPLGVLLPAAASLLTGNSSDPGALWIFRLMSAAALGGAAAFLVLIGRRLGYGAPVILFLVAWFGTEAKTLDFTINGMETGFLLFFLAYTLWAQLASGPRQAWHLGGAWAGLMWTRPDSFIYIGLIAAGCWLFNDRARTGRDRRQVFALCWRAGLITTALYLPWLLFAWGYYGTPVPHTITAKESIGEARTLSGLVQAAVSLPWTTWKDPGTSLELTYLPSYFMIGGWPQGLALFSRGLATLGALLWLVPRVSFATRVASLAFFGVHAYLTYFPYFPFPWYIPGTTLLCTLALSGLVAQLAGWHRRLAQGLGVAAAVLVGLNLWVTGQVGRQVKAQQTYIEDGTRRKIGEWLRAHSQPGDTLFMEPLGYIGYFSGLKTYDFPGMSSLEMVRARHVVGNDWSLLIEYLGPKWVVLRPHESARVNEMMPGLLAGVYLPVQTFDQLEAVQHLDVPGRPYLEHDARFTVYERQRVLHFSSAIGEVLSYFPAGPKEIDGMPMVFAHAPSTIIVPVPAGATSATVHYAFEPGAYLAEDRPTDGAMFAVDRILRDKPVNLVNRTLDPVQVPGDRGLKQFHFPLPKDAGGGTLLLRTYPGKTMDRDWTCWSRVEFK